uniref:Integrase catalytic domain-containing protein n=1 Tax=Fagus sylvatica TaxID=28930 RepID=A0A2N9HDD0_FAGSY
MCSFLKGRKLWLYVTGQRHPPKQQKNKTEDAFALRLEDWDGVNHQIITWFRNTSTPSVSMEFGDYDTAKDVWDMLTSRYAGSDGARKYHLMITLYQLRQDPGERITAFHSCVRFLWDQLAASEPVISQLLNRSPLPTVNQAVNDLVRKETHLKSHRSSQPHTTVLATPASIDPTVTALPKGHDKRRSNQKNSHLICAFCKYRSHTIDRCNMRARILQRSAALIAFESVPSSDTASFDPVSLTTPTYSIADLQALFNQSEWFLDSAYCNHMTDNPPHLTSAHTSPVLPTITTADGSAMTVSHVGSISTPNLSVSDAFCVPKLHLNLLSIGQLTELGLNLFFSSRGCLVQDSRTGQIIGTAHKVGQLFELTSFHFPSSLVSAPVIVASASIELWHSRLGHVSLSRIQTLVSKGLLGSVSSSPFDYVWGPSPVPTNQYSKAIKVFYSNNAREYKQTDFSTIHKHYGTIFHISCAGTSQQNGRAERKLRHILDTVRALTNAASTPVSFWGEAALTAVYTINRCPSPVVQNTTPYERLFGTAPNYSLLKSPSVDPSSDESPTTDPTFDESPLSAPAANPVNTTTPEPRRSHWASSDPLWQQAMKEELDALLKIGETFAPVARLSSVRTLIAVSASRHWPLFQMDVKNVFLNGELTEEVYMQLPPGFSQPPGFSHKVCRLHRALYGLKQAPRAWFAKFSSTISQHGFSASSYDSALFFRRSDHGITLLLLYVDDMIITGDDVQGIQDLKRFLGQHFEMKDLGPLSYFLGLEVSSSSDGYYLTQAKYTSDLISRAGITDNKILVGSLVYFTITRLDISYAVHIVSQFMAAPRSLHYAAVLRILRYLKRHLVSWNFTSHLSRRSLFRLILMSTRLGTLLTVVPLQGIVFFLVTLSSLGVARNNLLLLILDLGIDCSIAVPIHCDNRSAIQIAHNDVFHECTKHIEIDCHFVRHHLLQGTLQLHSVSSQDQLADIFTKHMPQSRFRDLISKLKLVSLHPT